MRVRAKKKRQRRDVFDIRLKGVLIVVTFVEFPMHLLGRSASAFYKITSRVE